MTLLLLERSAEVMEQATVATNTVACSMFVADVHGVKRGSIMSYRISLANGTIDGGWEALSNAVETLMLKYLPDDAAVFLRDGYEKIDPFDLDDMWQLDEYGANGINGVVVVAWGSREKFEADKEGAYPDASIEIE